MLVVILNNTNVYVRKNKCSLCVGWIIHGHLVCMVLCLWVTTFT